MDVHKNDCDAISQRVVHFDDENGLIFVEIFNEKEAPLQATKRKPLALLLRHEFSKLFLGVNSSHLFAVLRDLVHHVLVGLLFKHVAAEELDDLRLQSWECTGSGYHGLTHCICIKLGVLVEGNDV